MARIKATSANESQRAALGEIDWAKNNHELVFALLEQLEKPDNFKVLFGKKELTENTSRKSKASVYKSIAEALFPCEFKTYADQLVSRIRSRVQTLRNQYSTHVKQLRKTGEGIWDDGSETSTEVNELMVPADGPDSSTGLRARNIWDEIIKKCPYFPILHRILCTRPNVTPPAITTGVGPNGRHTVYLPPPHQQSHSPTIPIDPVLASQTPTYSQPCHISPSPSQAGSPSLSQDLELSPPSPTEHNHLSQPPTQALPPPPSQYLLQKACSVSQPPMRGSMNTVRGPQQMNKKPTASIEDFLANVSPKPRLKRNHGADDVYEMIETVVSNHAKLEIQRHEADSRERELRLIMIE